MTDTRSNRPDRIYQAFLAQQREYAMAFAASRSLLDLEPAPGRAPDRYVATFRCRTVTRTSAGLFGETELSRVGIWLPPEYLRRVDQLEILTWLGPASAWNPNLVTAPNGRGYICIGSIAPGTPVVELIERCHDLIRFANVNLCENDALNPAACGWARQQQARFPIDSRSLAGTDAGPLTDLDIIDVEPDATPRT